MREDSARRSPVLMQAFWPAKAAWSVWLALTSLAILLCVATIPEYFTQRGFPLDDAWIHAVYGRQLATEGSLAYNPGVPATGATSPIWALLLAPVHLAFSGGPEVLATKLLGLALHLLMGAGLMVAFRSTDGRFRPEAVCGATLVTVHPDMLAAAVSGMEVSSASAIAAWALVALQRERLGLFAGACALAYATRPELAPCLWITPFLWWILRRPLKALAWSIGGLTASVITFIALAGRNLAVSGRPLPATYYAKVFLSSGNLWDRQVQGFLELLDQIVIADSVLLVALISVTGIASLWAFRKVKDPCADREPAFAAVSCLAGIVFFATSFLLIAPHDPLAFYHQRYALPGLPLWLVSVPILLAGAARALARTWPIANRVVVVVIVMLFPWLVWGTASRYHRLSNDALNIDDVQVELGRALSDASPDDVVWAVDAGAVRYFGRARVVDMMGLNTPEMLSADPERAMAASPPRYLELVSTWVEPVEVSGQLEAVPFVSSTPYTVTSNPAMAKHYLARCSPTQSGVLSIRGRTVGFSCAP